ncbi:MAG: metallophosphoesterase [Planctomycetota bacterium]
MKRASVIVLTVLAFWQASISAAEILRGTWLSNPKMDQMSVSWVTNAPDVGEVAYGETANYGQIAARYACNEVRRKKDNQPIAGEYVCKARLTKLVPGKTYYYKVSGNGLTNSVESSFRIPKETDPLTVVFLGDFYCGNRADFDKDIAHIDQYVKKGTAIGIDPDGVDMIVDVGDTRQHWALFVDPYVCLRQIPIIIAAGNHCNEVRADKKNCTLDYNQLQRYFDFDNNKLCHVVDYGPARWIMKAWEEEVDIHSDKGYEHNYGGDWNDEFSSDGMKWIESSLSETTRLWKFFINHNVFFTDNEVTAAPGGNKRIAQLWPMLMKYNVRVVVNGHDHVYQRTHQVDKDGHQHPNGIYNLVPSCGNGIRFRESPCTAKFYNQSDGSCAPIGKEGNVRWFGPTYLMVNGKQGICEAFNSKMAYRKDDSFTFTAGEGASAPSDRKKP